jgi:phage shock protein A
MTSLEEQLRIAITERDNKVVLANLHKKLIDETLEQFKKIPESKTVTTVKTFNGLKARKDRLEKDIKKLNKKIISMERKIHRGKT